MSRARFIRLAVAVGVPAAGGGFRFASRQDRAVEMNREVHRVVVPSESGESIGLAVAVGIFEHSDAIVLGPE